MVRLLGLDPGLRHTGWGIIEVDGNRLIHVADGAVHSDASCPLAQRLCQIHDTLSAVVDRYQPDEAAVEETFVNTNAASTLKLGQARAVSLLVPALAGMAVAEYTNNMVKKAVVGQGRADKTQVQAMVRMMLPGCDISTPDAADALAVAICHAHHRASWQMWRRGADAVMGQAAADLIAKKAVGKKAAAKKLAAPAVLDPVAVGDSLWRNLRDGRIGARFARNEALFGRNVDFISHDYRLVLDLGSEAVDSRREKLLHQAGFVILRRDHSETASLFLARIKTQLETAPGHQPSFLTREPT